MESLRIAHFSNLYLYYHFENLNIPPEVAASIEKMVRLRFAETMENLTNKNIDAVIFSGNTLYFDNILPKDLMEFNSIIEKFGRKVFIVPGDIDPYSLYSKFRFANNITVFEEGKITKVNFDDLVYFYGVGGELSSIDLIQSVSTSRNAINIFCSFFPNFDSENSLEISNFNYLALGGKSDPFFYKNFYFPGSFSFYGWNQGNSSYLISYVSKTENSVSKMSSNVPKTYSITLNFSKKVDIKEYIKDSVLKSEYKDSLLKVTLEGRTFEFVDFSEIEKELSKDFSYFEIVNNLIPDKRSLKKLESSFADLIDDRELLYNGIEFLRGKGDY